MLLNLISWNVNGIRAVERKGFLEWLYSNGAEIVALQETKAHPKQLSEKLLNPLGYRTYFSNAEKKGYSGVAVYSKLKPLVVKHGFGICEFDSEGRIIELEYEKFILLNIYYPNGGMSEERLQYKYRFYSAFIKYVKKIMHSDKMLIVCGDVNTAHKEIDLARPKANENNTGFLPEERAWLDRFVDIGLLDTFREFNKNGDNYTWWDYKTRARERNIGWRIDYFYIDRKYKDNLKNAYILKDIYGSDHCPIGITIEV